MFVMHRARHLARFVLVWFVLAMGVAMASPMVSPKALDLVCSSGGGMKLVVVGDDDTASTSHTLDCPLCASVSAPPPAARGLHAPTASSHALRSVMVVRWVVATAPPLPSRGPPAFS